MPRRTDPKCLANTLKSTNSKRPVEEISQCTRFALSGSRFCKNHQNLHQLTDEQLQNNTRICKGCKKHQYFPDMSYQICDACRDRGASNREKKRDEKIIFPPCVICGFVGGNDRQFVNYCNKHVTDGKKADIEAHGMKWCKGIIRGCPDPELPKEYPYERCEVCRRKENEQDHMRQRKIDNIPSTREGHNIPQNEKKKLQIKIKYTQALDVDRKLPEIPAGRTNDTIDCVCDKSKEDNQPTVDQPNKKENYLMTDEPLDITASKEAINNQNTKILNDGNNIFTKYQNIDSQKIHETQNSFYLYDGEIGEGKHCSGCNHFHEKSEFIGIRGNVVKTCLIHCRSIDRKRDRSNRDYSIYEKKSEVKEMRKLWKEQHPDKRYYQMYRDRKRSENPTDFLGHLAKNMKKYRARRPEYFKQINETHKKDMSRKYYTCRYRAKRDKIPFELTFNECKELCTGKCFYCGYIPNSGYLIGIDRLFSEGGYIIKNCVSCCEMCNFMKGELSPIAFINQCENILICQKYISGEQHTDVMPDSKSSSYSNYVGRAKKRNFEFELTERQFNEMCLQDCYLCGKKSNHPHHVNGIDRYDSRNGYIVSNCRPCCTMCNYLKNSYDFDDFMQQLKLIHSNNQVKNETEKYANVQNFIDLNK